MANGRDWDIRKARIQDQATTVLPNLLTNFELKTRSLNDLVGQVRRLEDEKGKLQHEIKLAELAASTADREFLERKETFPDPFKPSKLYTIQDITLFLFFVSFLLLWVAAAMTLDGKAKIFAVGLIVFVVMLVLLYRYA
jgi:hypothetical protein